jgi:di/tricarboxylate transporter
VPNAETFIRANDVLLVTGNMENLMKVQATEGIEIRPEFKLRDQDLQTSDMTVAEVLITPRSELIGRTLKETTFQQRYGMTALAVYRLGRSLREKLATIRLRSGDVLLVQGSKERLEELRKRREVAILEQRAPAIYKKEKGTLTLAFFGVALVLGGFGVLPLAVAFLVAAVLTLLFRCISLERAYEFVDWRLLILIGGMIAFGTAMEETGAAKFLANQIVSLLEPMGVLPILAGFFVLTIVLTQPMSNAAAALVVLPIALNTAQELEVNERTFAIGIMLAASISFVAPLEPSCVLVYGPGKYRFRDFLKTGLPLTLLLATVVLLLIPVFWPLRPG